VAPSFYGVILSYHKELLDSLKEHTKPLPLKTLSRIFKLQNHFQIYSVLDIMLYILNRCSLSFKNEKDEILSLLAAFMIAAKSEEIYHPSI
jgi:hypothetical protein